MSLSTNMVSFNRFPFSPMLNLRKVPLTPLCFLVDFLQDSILSVSVSYSLYSDKCENHSCAFHVIILQACVAERCTILPIQNNEKAIATWVNTCDSSHLDDMWMLGRISWIWEWQKWGTLISWNRRITSTNHRNSPESLQDTLLP